MLPMDAAITNPEKLSEELATRVLAALLPRFHDLEQQVERMITQKLTPLADNLEGKIAAAVTSALDPRLKSLEEACRKDVIPAAVAPTEAAAAARAEALEGTSQVGPFCYCVNRGKRSFDAAFATLAAEHSKFDSNTLFTYFDTYGGKQLPSFTQWQRKVQLIERSVTNDFDNKQIFAEKLQNAGCEHAFAPTYFSKEQALVATKDCGDALFFVKSALGTAGKGMRVLTRDELRDCKIAQGHVIQRAVQDLMLIDGRKFVIRFFVLIHDQAVYGHKRAVAIIHGSPYDRSSTDYNVQICHSFEKPELGVTCCTLDSQPDGAAWHRATAQRVLEITPALQGLIRKSSKDRYAIIGIDALIENSGNARLIEANLYPNLWDLQEPINVQVKQPMLRDVIQKTVLGIGSAELESIDVAAR
eukprot:TRINITY_DN72665_c0_g1_i1.p1 TRINITY_DN72665_c0_g1~~TRINITY_DN72665_c0_g1_i1.p1  ORF type:complete len:416 (+),score=90.85 TRINITY_DN72665_c0_g1_i1:56-1303(+)